MRLISSTLLTIAFLTLVVASDPATTTPPKVVGTIQEGGDCVTDSTPENSCASGLECDAGDRYFPGKDPGYCVKPGLHLEVGDVCVGWKTCRTGLFCKSDPGKPPLDASGQGRDKRGKCSEKLKLGEECAAQWQCANDLLCFDSKCSLKKKKNEVCKESHDCEDAFYCQRAWTDKVGKCADRKLADSPCDLPDQCATGLECKTNYGTDGLCMSTSYKGKVNGICFNNSDCETGLFCALTDKNKRGKCTARLAENAQCASYKDCVDGLYCDGAEAGKQGKCAKRKTDGGVCAFEHACADNYICKSAKGAGICVRREDYHKKHDAGGICASTSDCKPGLQCLQAKLGELGKCAPRSIKGEDCKTGYGTCASGLTCKGLVETNRRGAPGKCETSPEPK